MMMMMLLVPAAVEGRHYAGKMFAFKVALLYSLEILK